MTIRDYLRARYAVETNPLRTERRLELVALLLGLLLCLQLLYSGVRLAMGVDPGAVAPAADALQVGKLRQNLLVDEEQSAAVRGRPLFWYSRRAVEATPELQDQQADIQSAAKELKGIKLLGVFGSGDTAGIIALVMGKKQRILQGDAVQGWTLESVAPDRAVLATGDRRAELLLKQGKVIAVAQPLPVGKNVVAPMKGNGDGGAGQAGGTASNVSGPTPAQAATMRRLGGRAASPVPDGEQQAQ